MIKFFKQWREKKEAEEQERKFDNGFNWVMNDFYVKKKCVEEIEGHIECSRTFGNYDHFEKGAEHALGIIALGERLKAEKQYSMTQKQMQDVFDEWRHRDKKAINNKVINKLSDSEYFIMLFEQLLKGPGNE